MTVPIVRQPNIELGLKDHTNIALTFSNTILETTNNQVELEHSWETIEQDISVQEHWNARQRQPRNHLYLSFSYTLVLLFIYINPSISRIRIGLSHDINPIAKIGRRNIIFSTQQSTLRRTLSYSTSSSFSPLPIIHKMESSGGYGVIGGSYSYKPSSSSVIGILYSHQVPVQSTTNLAKVIKRYGIFQFEEDATTSLWHVFSPLNLAPTTHPLTKFKYHLPRFPGNNTITKNEHLVAFSNSCQNIGANDNDICMRLFVNSFEGKVGTDFFELLPNIIYTWEELFY
jgi:hypothetical protein